MSVKNDGGSAFPTQTLSVSAAHPEFQRDGMSLRDYFAAQAMQANMIGRALLIAAGGSITSDAYQSVVMDTYDYADAMLKEREK